ncbi:hypothetical protein [Clostridium tagluense]|uniref:F5/8 type C domain-containing protein n=1 Tax=Clostridium tagluense TaxID=360422 RepID=A0A401UQI4_9CLOT|nr:hypothetical protein [Clostridium tagluense]GCD11784.1 hypothetical protein Ctaglu_34070 [Clostridium tagluense]
MAKEYTENIIPNMTSNNTPSGTVSSSGCLNSSWYDFNAFNYATLTNGWIGNIANGSWIQYQFNTGKKIKKYTISNVTGANNIRYPRGFSLKASNTGLFTGEEVTLDTQINLIFTNGEKKTFICSTIPKISYLYYRITDIASSTWQPVISMIEMMEEVNKTKFLLKDGNKCKSVSVDKYTDDLIPIMISNTSPSGIASASGEHVGKIPYQAWRAFDDKSIKGLSSWGIKTIIGWLAYEFPVAQRINKYTLLGYSQYDSEWKSLMPNSWTFEGSNDSSTWVILDTQNNINDWQDSVKKTFMFNNGIAYKKYRININKNNGHASFIELGGLEMMMNISYKSSLNLSYPPTENDFLTNGMDDISPLYNQEVNPKTNELLDGGEVLGSGIVHKYHVNKSDMENITGFTIS